MRNYNLSRTARVNWPAGARVLALWPLLALACSVYDDTLVQDVTNPLGGGSGASSNGGTAANGGGGASSAGRASGGGGSGSTTAGTSSGGTAGEPTTQAGSGGDMNASGSGGTAAAGTTTTAGAGGEPPGEDAVLVDDMEDGDAGIEIKDGRNGYWYAGNDGTAGGSMVPPSTMFSMAELSDSDRSLFAAGLKATGFTTWGSVMGFNFVEQAGAVKPYDASAYCGVRFWGKAAAVTTVRLRVPDGDTHPSGGVCKDPGASGTACYDHFGAKVALTTSWKQISVEFAALDQLGTGYHPADGKLKASKLYALEWALSQSAGTYQIWVDDVELIKCP